MRLPFSRPRPRNRVAADTVAQTPPPGCWVVCERAGADQRRDIEFKKFPGDVPSDQSKLKNEIERTLSALYVLYSGSKDRAKLDASFEKLLSLAQVGLVGARPSTSTAVDALASLQAEILDQEAGRVKNFYLRRVGVWGLILLSIPCILSFMITEFVVESIIRDYVRNILLVWAACMVGTWLSVATRKLTMSFYDLARIEEDQLDPSIRLAFTGLLTLVLALMLSTGLIAVTIGGFHANEWPKSVEDALLLGALAGLGEKALPANIMKHAGSLMMGKEPEKKS